MRKELRVASAVLAAVVFVGCDSKEETTTPAPPPVAPQSSNTVSDQVKDATANVQNAAANAENAAKNAASNAQAQANTAVANATDAVQEKLKQVGQYIADKKYDLADSTLTEVEKAKPSLPQTLQTQIDALRQQLNAAKATGGGLPSLPK